MVTSQYLFLIYYIAMSSRGRSWPATPQRTRECQVGIAATELKARLTIAPRLAAAARDTFFAGARFCDGPASAYRYPSKLPDALRTLLRAPPWLLAVHFVVERFFFVKVVVGGLDAAPMVRMPAG